MDEQPRNPWVYGYSRYSVMGEREYEDLFDLLDSARRDVDYNEAAPVYVTYDGVQVIDNDGGPFGGEFYDILDATANDGRTD